MFKNPLPKIPSHAIVLSLFLLMLSLSYSTLSFSKLSPLAPAPNWRNLDKYQHTMSRQEFIQKLEIFAQSKIYQDFMILFPHFALIQKSSNRPNDFFVLYFSNKKNKKINKKSFKTLSVHSKKAPLKGLKIALDPGHIGGNYAKIEDRWFQPPTGTPIIEGEITLKVAKLLKKRLESLGAQVFLVRSSTLPLTKDSPQELRSLARKLLKEKYGDQIVEKYQNHTDPNRNRSVQWKSESLTYRTSEIRERARRIRAFNPDITLCLHFDAIYWGDAYQPRMIEENSLHIIPNGSYLPEELEFEDMRFQMLTKLLSRDIDLEIPLSQKIVSSFLKKTDLAPASYFPSLRAKKLDESGYLWARNLLANRLYPGPVIFLEPYYMNNLEVAKRIQMGDFTGTKQIGDKYYSSIFREYSDAVTRGVVEFYQP